MEKDVSMGRESEGEHWLNRTWAAGQAKDAVNFAELAFDPESGLHMFDGNPFTGTCVTWWSPGELESVTHFVDGASEGVSVAWHQNGNPEVYNEMLNDVCHGWHVRWNLDGSLKEKFRCVNGRPET